MLGKCREMDDGKAQGKRCCLGNCREKDAGKCRERNAGKLQRKECWESAEKGMLGKCRESDAGKVKAGRCEGGAGGADDV